MPNQRQQKKVKAKQPKKDADLRIRDWVKLGAEVLRLRCDARGLMATGKKDDLARRLYEHFHPEEVAEGEREALTDNVGEVFTERTEIPRAKKKKADKGTTGTTASERTEEEDTMPYDEDDTTSDPPFPTDEEAIAAIVDARVQGALQSVVEELQVARAELQQAREQQTIADEEINALRSELRQKKRPRHEPDFEANRSNTRGNSVSLVPPGSGNTTRQDILPAANPYPLPALLPKTLKMIEEGEYIDFDKLKPKKLGGRDESDGYSLRLMQGDDGEEGTVCLKKTSSSYLETFPEWLGVWNTFVVARLHFRPDEHASLLAYQTAIAQFAKSYRFSAVYSYDIDFRKKMAAERQLAPAHRTTFWGTQHLELKNQHLHDQFIQPATCYNCKETGHKASNCPKKTRRNFNGQQFRFAQSPTPPYQQFPFQAPAAPSAQPSPPQQQAGQQRSNSNGGQAPRTNTNAGTCNYLNHKGQCYRQSTCPFRHVCNRCGQAGHGGINCAHNTSTAFRPQYNPGSG